MNHATMAEAMLDPEVCWRAVTARDAAQDGRFYYGVTTTGVYCRPSCPSRGARRENVRFFGTAAEAEGAGLRPCKRCRPLDPAPAARIRELCGYIEAHAGESLTLSDLSARAGISPHHLQRSFKAVVGVTPKQYLDHARMESFKSTIRGGGDVTGAIYEAGFGSLSRVYEKADTHLGMTPMEYRDGGRGVEIVYAAADSPVGRMMLGATGRGLCFLQFGEDDEALAASLRAHYPQAEVRAAALPYPPEFAAWMNGLNRYLAGQEPHPNLPVHVRATAFQLQVWTYLRGIPRGSVESYREVAEGIGRPTAARAVARACASNAVAIAIPCHRVIRGDGDLGGYRWGMERKRVLLGRERSGRV